MPQIPVIVLYQIPNIVLYFIMYVILNEFIRTHKHTELFKPLNGKLGPSL